MTHQPPTILDLHPLLQAWGLDASEVHIRRITTGLINQTYHVKTSAGAQYALQRLAPIFGKEVHQDIASVTEHLCKKGHPTPRLVPTHQGNLDLNLQSEPQGLWRLMTWIDGQCITRISDTATAHEAGLALGQFHASLADYESPFAHQRLGVHDTQKHLDGLQNALKEAAPHQPEYNVIQSLGEAILTAAQSIPPMGNIRERVVHGDPKISNLIFGDDGRWRAWIDLDTVSRMHIHLELGDAFRSWCNPTGEDAETVAFDLDLFRAAIHGYAKGAQHLLNSAELDAIVWATYQITVELAARFCRDAIEDVYFGWDPERFPNRVAHNRARAQAQLTLSQSILSNLSEAQSIVQNTTW